MQLVVDVARKIGLRFDAALPDAHESCGGRLRRIEGIVAEHRVTSRHPRFPGTG